MVILENIDIDIDIDKAILQNIDIDKISNRFIVGISNRATTSALFSSTHSHAYKKHDKQRQQNRQQNKIRISQNSCKDKGPCTVETGEREGVPHPLHRGKLLQIL